jgi:hypothetical protein
MMHIFTNRQPTSAPPIQLGMGELHLKASPPACILERNEKRSWVEQFVSILPQSKALVFEKVIPKKGKIEIQIP